MAGDLLGVDGVRLDPGAGIGLVVTGAFERRTPGRGPRPRGARGRAAPWRSARAPRARCPSPRSPGRPRRASAASDSRRLLPDEPFELRGQDVDLGDVRLLAREQVLGGRQVVQAERAEALRRVGLDCRSSASISDRPRRRRSISMSRSWALHVVRCGASTARRPQDHADPADDPADQRRDRSRGWRPEDVERRPSRRRG